MLSVQSLVAPATTSVASANTVVRAPLFGVVSAVNGGPPPTDVDVLWQTGEHVQGIPVAALDQIVDASVAVANLIGRVVIFKVGAAATGPEFQGVVVSAFQRVPGGTGTPSAPLVVVQSLTVPGLMYEVPATLVEVVPGR